MSIRGASSAWFAGGGRRCHWRSGLIGRPWEVLPFFVGPGVGECLGAEGQAPDAAEVVLGPAQVEGERLVEEADGGQGLFQPGGRAGGGVEDLVEVVGDGAVGGAFGGRAPVLSCAVPGEEVGSGHDELVAVVAVEVPAACPAVGNGVKTAEPPVVTG